MVLGDFLGMFHNGSNKNIGHYLYFCTFLVSVFPSLLCQIFHNVCIENLMWNSGVKWHTAMTINSAFFGLSSKGLRSTLNLADATPNTFSTTQRAHDNLQLKVLLYDPLECMPEQGFIKQSVKANVSSPRKKIRKFAFSIHQRFTRREILLILLQLSIQGTIFINTTI